MDRLEQVLTHLFFLYIEEFKNSRMAVYISLYVKA